MKRTKIKADPAGWREHLLVVEEKDLTLAELAAAWLDHQAKTGSRSMRDRRSVVQVHLVPAFGAVQARALTEDMVAAWAEWHQRAGAAPKTTRKVCSMLSGVMDFGRQVGACDKNPVLGLRRGILPPPVVRDPGRRALHTLTVEDVRRVVECAHLPLIQRALWTGFFFTGARFGELSALTEADVIASAPLPCIEISKSWDCKAAKVGPTKTEATRRVPLHPRLASVLSEVRAWRRAQVDRPSHPTDLLFPWVWEHDAEWNPRHWQEKTALSRFRQDLELAGVTPAATGDVRDLHDARHTFVSMMHSAGVADRTVHAMTHLGKYDRDAHTLYVHLSWPALCEAMMRHPAGAPKRVAA